jgi:hypothetical protein
MAVKLFICSAFVFMKYMYLAATIRHTVTVLTYKQYQHPKYTEVTMELDG